MGKHLEAKKIYKSKHVCVRHLNKGTNLKDATDYIDRCKTKCDNVVFIVGSNDLATMKSVSACEVELDKMISSTWRAMGANTPLSPYPRCFSERTVPGTTRRPLTTTDDWNVCVTTKTYISYYKMH